MLDEWFNGALTISCACKTRKFLQPKAPDSERPCRSAEYPARRRWFAHLGEGLGTGASTVPFVMFAEASEMFFDLRTEFGESGFAGGREMLAFLGSVQCGRGQDEVQREAELLGSRKNGKNAVKLNEIGIIIFQKLG